MVFVGILKQIGVLLFRFLTPAVIFFRFLCIDKRLIKSTRYNIFLFFSYKKILYRSISIGV